MLHYERTLRERGFARYWCVVMDFRRGLLINAVCVLERTALFVNKAVLASVDRLSPILPESVQLYGDNCADEGFSYINLMVAINKKWE
mgnify:CR=1 FL=1|jgi:hypothetical protein